VVNAQVLKGIGSGCDEEALRVVSSLPDWTPGKREGEPVNVKMVLPITFALAEK
jgi:protein TonB